MRRYIAFLLLSIAFLSGCNRNSPSLATNVAVEQSPTSTSFSVEEGSRATEVYLLTSSSSFPITYSVVHTPIACLLFTSECQGVQSISEFPSSEFSSSSDAFNWSPDGLWASIFNGYSSDLLILNGRSEEINRSPANLSVVSGQTGWSPDSKWVASSVQGDDEFTSRIVLIDPMSNMVRDLPTDLDGMLFPVGWSNNRELVVVQFKYGFPDGQTDQKKGGNWRKSSQA